MIWNQQKYVSVLLVEDLKEHAEYVRLLLEKEHFSVKTAIDERSALDILLQQNIDLILMDVTLENGNGFEFCKKLRGEERFSNIPIIFLTSKNDVKDKVSGFQAGGDDYLTKPFKLQELLARIELSLQKKKLIESENKYRNFVERLNSLVFMLDITGKIVGVNPKVISILDFKQSEILNQSIYQFIHKEYRTTFQQSFDEILSGKEIHQMYLRLASKNEQIVPVEMNGFVFKENDKIIQVQVVMSDIMEREHLQEEVQRYTQLLEKQVENRTKELDEAQHLLILSDKMGTIGQLAAGIAHELRNPLSIIGTSAYYLNRTLNDQKNSKVKDHLQIIQSEISRSQKIITNLLDFSRKSCSERESADINKLIRQTISLIERELDNHEIKIKMDLEPLPLCFINVDEIKQVFLNLFLNAKDAMPNGGTLHVKSSLYDKEAILVKIQDSGIGINKNHLKRIFDPFFTTKSEADGIGLGLSLVHSSIKRNRGKIRVESYKGEGTSFFVYLPVRFS